jgi:BTB/POZ domain
LQADSSLSLVQEREYSQGQLNSEPLDVPDANVVIQSSDFVHFRVHKPVLAMASPVFKDLFSLHQPSDSESVDGLPVVQLTEDAELLNSLLSMFYPVHLVIPKSYEQVLYLLAACQKYKMDQIQAFIRAEVNHGNFPMPVGTEVFRAYAIASSKRLIPEMEDAARLTLDYPMTFETLGEELRLFEGSALRDLAHFRQRCRDNLVACLRSPNLYKYPFNMWMPCATSYSSSIFRTGSPPIWLTNFVKQRLTELGQAFTRPLPNSSNFREEYLSALRAHTVTSGNVTCVTCSVVHTMKGEIFCEEIENRLEQAISEVGNSPFYF